MIQLTPEGATLLAAIIAATAAVLSVFLQIRDRAQSEMRVARRASLEPYIQRLSKSLHEIVATSKTLCKTNPGDARTNWREKAQKPKDEIKELRTLLRYSLWGLDRGLRDLSRLPDWTAALQGDPSQVERLLDLGDKLKNTIDAAVRACYSNGRTPSLWHRFAVKVAAWRFVGYWNKTRGLRAQRSAAQTSEL